VPASVCDKRAVAVGPQSHKQLPFIAKILRNSSVFFGRKTRWYCVKSKTNREGFVRWQGITITQFGYLANLILGFATASLGFSLTLLGNKDFVPPGYGKYLFLISLIAFMLSIFVGVWCAINRLRDFRKTKQIARDREALSDAELTRKRNEVDRLGECTWRLFKFQIVTFGVGVFTLFVVFVMIYHNKLF
jgi:hypothetical protein